MFYILLVAILISSVVLFIYTSIEINGFCKQIDQLLKEVESHIYL